MVGTITVNNISTGLFENNIESALVFDNRNSELKINHQGSGPLKGNILIHSIDGKLITSDMFFTYNNRIKINNYLKRGVYIFTIVLKNKTLNSKFIF